MDSHAGLIFDVGLHKGEDTDFYLKKGFRVVGFEADPQLIAHCKARFKNQISRGKLVIVEGAIIDMAKDRAPSSGVKFYRNKCVSVWGTVCADWATRNSKRGSPVEIIEVPAVNFSECLREHGMPYYLKIDIEGMDRVCLEALGSFETRPDYVSLESQKVSWNGLKEELALLSQLGYTGFKAVQQCGISAQEEPNPCKEGSYAAYKFEEGSSGLFGADLPGEWKDLKDIMKQYRRIFVLYEYFGDFGKLTDSILGKVSRKAISAILRKPIPGWYDTHAKHSSA